MYSFHVPWTECPADCCCCHHRRLHAHFSMWEDTDLGVSSGKILFLPQSLCSLYFLFLSHLRFSQLHPIQSTTPTCIFFQACLQAGGSFKSLLEGHASLQGTQTVTGTKEPETQKFMGRSLLSVQCASPEQPRKEALVQTCGLHCMQKQRHSCGLCKAAAAPICCMGEKEGTNQVTCSRSSDIEEGPFMLPWELVRWVLIQVGIKIIQVGRRNFNLKIKPLLKPDNENNIMSQNWASYLLLCGNGQIYTECLPEQELNLKPFLDFFQIQFWENEVLQFFKSL